MYQRNLKEGELTNEKANVRVKINFHTHRTPCRDRDHRDFGINAPTCLEQGKGARTGDRMPE